MNNVTILQSEPIVTSQDSWRKRQRWWWWQQRETGQ